MRLLNDPTIEVEQRSCIDRANRIEGDELAAREANNLAGSGRAQLGLFERQRDQPFVGVKDGKAMHCLATDALLNGEAQKDLVVAQP